ncbi:MAG: hypothetical protein GY822_32355 [Deltaproteobacteria bacterium]|nr:hypothetical protein [Deltaproteobacteria bacterium]
MSVQNLPIPSRLRHVANKLSILRLMEDDDDENIVFTERDSIWETRGGRPNADHFLDFYSDPGLRHAFAAYGVHDALVKRGFAEYHFKITRSDAFHHRLEILIGDDDDDDDETPYSERQVMDLRIHLTALNPTSFEQAPEFSHALPVMVVEWLTMQNPKLRFTSERPRLPGQRFPGTGMGRVVHSLLLIMAERLRRHAVIQVPEHHHLARLYHRAGYRFASEKKEMELLSVNKSLSHLPFAVAAWAVERGFVFQREQPEGPRQPFEYRPQEMALALSREMKHALVPSKGFFQAFLSRSPRASFEVDFPGLRQSLFEHPVAGLEASVLEKL